MKFYHQSILDHAPPQLANLFEEWRLIEQSKGTIQQPKYHFLTQCSPCKLTDTQPKSGVLKDDWDVSASKSPLVERSYRVLVESP